MTSPNEVEIQAEDVIQSISSQRDAALNEIARQSAIIRALQRQIEELQKPKEVKDGGKK